MSSMRVLFVLIGLRTCGVTALARFPCSRRHNWLNVGNPSRHGCTPPTYIPVTAAFRRTSRMALSSSQDVEQTAQADEKVEIDPTMRVAEIRGKLDALSIDYSDCFDKESLLARLRSAPAKTGPTASVTERPEESSEQSGATNKDESYEPTQRNESLKVDADVIRQEVAAMSVRSLREELASQQIRWAGLLEKRDLVQAVVDARIAARSFSATGILLPGKVTDLTDDQLRHEIAACNAPPLLVDVYAVWCGPCQLMAKQLVEAAAQWRDSVRVVKIDSDKYPAMAGTLRAQALPTLLLFAGANEIGRIEGAMNKDQLVQWVQSKLPVNESLK